MKRITVGFFIHQLEDDYANLIMKGAIAAAEDLDINLVIFPGKLLNGRYYDNEFTKYEYQYNVLYEFGATTEIDGLVVSAGTIGTFVDDRHMKRFLGRYRVPLITIERRVADYPCLMFNADSICDIVHHLVNEHHCKRIAFVSGPKNNEDAELRLSAYKKALAECGIPVDEKLIAYGNFSEYSIETVNELLDSCGETPEAICFANDTMCIGAYKALRARGLEPGKDILITGYDDSPVALAMNPMLTTVKASADVLGYRAVESIYNIINGRKADIHPPKSSVVLRNSCGCSTNSNVSGKELLELTAGMTDDEAASFLIDRFAAEELGKRRQQYRRQTAALFHGIIDLCLQDSDTRNDGKVVELLDNLLHGGVLDELPYDELIGIVDIARKYTLAKYPACNLSELFMRLYRVTLDYSMQISHEVLNKKTNANFIISNLARDMMIYAKDESSSCYSILDKLKKINVKSSFLYEYRDPIIHNDTAEWVTPDKILLLGYQVGEKVATLPPEERLISPSEMINNRFTPDKARVIVASLLFASETQYGILLCDLDQKDFPFIFSLTPQIGTAIMLSSMMMQLEGSLEAAHDTNVKLNEMSMCDELTGVYNRRGFNFYANALIQDPKNAGQPAIVIFADIDNLKKINDRLGHDDGDYAIRTAAGYLKSGLRHTDVVARTGGDEFTAVAIVKSPDNVENLYDKLKALAEEHNRKSGKNYNVNMSIGMYAFTCGSNVKVQDYVDIADGALYEDKKHKDSDIWKKM